MSLEKRLRSSIQQESYSVVGGQVPFSVIGAAISTELCATEVDHNLIP